MLAFKIPSATDISDTLFCKILRHYLILNWLINWFPDAQIEQLITPMMMRGAKVDRNTLAVKLLQARHPLAQGAMAMIMAAVTAISILCLQEIF